MSSLIVFGLLVWVAPIIVAEKLGESRNRTGWMWGFFLGWVGVVVLAVMPVVTVDPQARELEAVRRQQELEQLRADFRGER